MQHEHQRRALSLLRQRDQKAVRDTVEDAARKPVLRRRNVREALGVSVRGNKKQDEKKREQSFEHGLHPHIKAARR